MHMHMYLIKYIYKLLPHVFKMLPVDTYNVHLYFKEVV